MYEQFWNFARRPFTAGIAEEIYYPSETHHGALLKIRFGIEHRHGAVILTGIVGMGKTLLSQQLLGHLPESFSPRAHVIFSQFAARDLLLHIVQRLGIPIDSQTREHDAVDRLSTFLHQNTSQGKHAVLVVDEGHLLKDPASLEVLRLLMNFTTAGEPDLSLLFVGQPQILANLNYCAGLEERMGVKCLLRPFSLEDTASYISHRLTLAGGTNGLFTNEAIERIYELSGGTPGRINRLCDLSLLIGFAEEASQISARHIEAVADEMVSLGDFSYYHAA
jgi:type II secretory pathway predicted ATPase ExeA